MRILLKLEIMITALFNYKICICSCDPNLCILNTEMYLLRKKGKYPHSTLMEPMTLNLKLSFFTITPSIKKGNHPKLGAGFVKVEALEGYSF